MNREECLEALNYFYEEVSIDEYNTKLDDKNYQILEKLIGEHLDNPPLKFEELKEKTWYWHNPSKSWIYLFKPLNWEPEKGLRYAERIIDHSADGYYMSFKTGTLFRKQVEE